MPNHITNILTITGNPTARAICLNQIKGSNEEGQGRLIDFEKIIPMPPHIFRGNLSAADEQKHGKENCWYDWSIKNWGTKWNAYSIENKGDNRLQFDTAWSMPDPVFRKLSEMYPDLKFTVRYADEDIGNNCGTAIYKDGNKTFIEPKNPDDFARRVKRG